jgi:hypothetical protein
MIDKFIISIKLSRQRPRLRRGWQEITPWRDRLAKRLEGAFLEVVND